MTDVTAANPADEGPVTLVDAVEQAKTEASQTEAQNQAGDSEDIDALTREALGETEAKPEDEVEVEYEGEKLKLPPKWRDAFLRDQDYRRKTMDLAEQRKALETEREQHASIAKRDQVVFEANVKIASLDRDIRNLEAADITGWTPEQIANGNRALANLQNERATLANALTAHAQEQERVSSEQTAKLREKALSEAGARVPNFTDQRRTELEQFAVSSGIDADAFKGVVSASEYELLHFADIGKKFIERQRKAATMKAAQAGSPAATLGGGSAGGKAPEQMSPSEMAKHLGLN